MAEKKTKKNEMSFESAMERITEISDILSQGKLSLDESVELYCEGMKLIAFCKEKLEGAERKISVVSDKNNNKTTQYISQEE